jgi:hypothetical protein
MRNFIFSLSTKKQTKITIKKLIVELGQSNMRGRDGDTQNTNYPFTSTNGYWWNGNQQFEITTLRGDVQSGEGSHANYFAEKYFELTSNKAVMIYAAQGDTGLTPISKPNPNNWSATGNLRSNAETTTDAALIYYNKSLPDAAIWCQGEKDARELQSNNNYSKAQIKAGMQSVINWWQNKYPDVPFYISETGDEDPPEETGDFQTVRDVQNEIVSENNNVIMAFTGAKNFPSQGFMSDDIHYDFRGYKLMGEAFALAASQ